MKFSIHGGVCEPINRVLNLYQSLVVIHTQLAFEITITLFMEKTIRNLFYRALLLQLLFQQVEHTSNCFFTIVLWILL